MSFPKSFATKSYSMCLLAAAIDPVLLSLFGCVIILLALLVTWRPMPKSKL